VTISLHTSWAPPTPPADPITYSQGVDETEEDFLLRWILEVALDSPGAVSRVCTAIDNDPEAVCTSRLEGETKAELLRRHKNAVEALLP
jgi:hypothetical protein